jgi:hypothetical protein
VSKLTQERDELSKKVYWAEMARDQTKAAKEIATEDALKARCAFHSHLHFIHTLVAEYSSEQCQPITQCCG